MPDQVTHQATEAETTVEVHCTGHIRGGVGEPRFEYSFEGDRVALMYPFIYCC